MSRIAFRAALAVSALALAAPASAASTGALRTFVSGLGVDSSACNLAATPCRTFAYALTKTVAGGEVIAQDPAEYGPMNITQSVTLTGSAPGAATVTAASGGDAIDINAAGANVVLRGLETIGGGNGILVSAATNVAVSDSVVRGAGTGISVNSATATTIAKTSIVESATNGVALNDGMLVMTGDYVSGGSNAGVYANLGTATVDDCIITSARFGESFEQQIIIKGSFIFGNSPYAIAGSGNLYLDSTTETLNPYGVKLANGQTQSYGNNNILDSSDDIAKVPPD